MFNTAQFNEIARIILQLVGAMLVSKGYMSADDVATFSGAVITVIGVGFSVWTRRNTGLIKSAANVADVTAITVEPASKAANLPSEKISTAA